ncbi:MAG TPA: type 4a pilus biogenesis protein PilO [Acidobacteriota bacterium]|nr:type 4a pilus biogenesis protein PilO [Acidobacteriota bacterium]
MASDSSNVRQMVLLIVLALGVCVVIYIYGISPLQSRQATLESEIEQLEAEVMRARAVKAQLPQLQEQIRQQEEKLASLRRVLPTAKETAEVVRRVQELAVESKLHLRSFTPQDTVQRDFYEDWPILLSMEGNFDTLGVFLERIGRFQRIVNVERLSIKPLDADQRTPTRTISATCTATTYVFQEASDDS